MPVFVPLRYKFHWIFTLQGLIDPFFRILYTIDKSFRRNIHYIDTFSIFHRLSGLVPDCPDAGASVRVAKAIVFIGDSRINKANKNALSTKRQG